ncbi:hypothetical protein ACFFTM_05235 [Pseudoduganella plicata]|uniref:ABC transporter permease n=1 Tax=Pseudoduganella plicata TaxID=321984 RepID=A0A4P7BJV8_9BURK|nr:hypothetical protein [Pseudoduganella plicata]QBQ38730.1 hypothetical protein E1742_23060 [Pseudoduganella plicata]GGY84594.1 hypothetical protein GCM10007388_17140 [Pseudoduganella plicata]
MTSILSLSARAALQWRLLLLWAACVLLPTLLLAIPVYSLLAGQLDYSTHAPALARALDIVALGDLATVLGRQMPAIGTAGFGALALTLALSPLLSGAVVAAARAPDQLRFRALLAGALAEYPRMARMLCWAVVPLGAAVFLGMWLLDMARAHGRTVILPEDARNATLAAGAAAALLVLLVNLTLDAGRAALATDRRRTSAVAGWWRGLGLLAQRPGPVLSAYALFTVAGLVLAASLALGRLQVPPVGPVQLIAALLLTQLIALVIGWMRVARLFALVRVAMLVR